jgi:WD40 repeat protein
VQCHWQDGSDWFVVWNPAVNRILDVSHVYTLAREGYVCVDYLIALLDDSNRVYNCVCFSPDGKYLAATDFYMVRIYDVATEAHNW